MRTGGCHCGSVRYELDGEPITHALCHCVDCRRSAGAPMVGWVMHQKDQVRVIKGAVATYRSSPGVERQFCAACGTGLFYVNEAMLEGIIDVQSATLDEPALLPAQSHIQVADRISWMASAHELPTFERYPSPP